MFDLATHPLRGEARRKARLRICFAHPSEPVVREGMVTLADLAGARSEFRVGTTKRMDRSTPGDRLHRTFEICDGAHRTLKCPVLPHDSASQVADKVRAVLATDFSPSPSTVRLRKSAVEWRRRQVTSGPIGSGHRALHSPLRIRRIGRPERPCPVYAAGRR